MNRSKLDLSELDSIQVLDGILTREPLNIHVLAQKKGFEFFVKAKDLLRS